MHNQQTSHNFSAQYLRFPSFSQSAPLHNGPYFIFKKIDHAFESLSHKLFSHPRRRGWLAGVVSYDKSQGFSLGKQDDKLLKTIAKQILIITLDYTSIL